MTVSSSPVSPSVGCCLPDLTLPAFLDTSANDLIREFFIPVLGCAARYDRGVGFFSSGWLRLAAHGMVTFAQNGGRARWVTSPILAEDDWDALLAGDAARTDSALREVLDRNVTDLARSLEEDTLSALAWMIADEILDFKLALPRNKLERGDFHDKFGVFVDRTTAKSASAAAVFRKELRYGFRNFAEGYD